LTRLASEKRGGGWVKCCSALTSRVGGVALGHRRQHAVVVVFGAFLEGFAVELEEAVEGED
jgi:hypothetical protein